MLTDAKAAARDAADDKAREQEANGRYNVVVQGSAGVITNLKRVSEASLNRLAKRYGWTKN
jgi:hypothetical protein